MFKTTITQYWRLPHVESEKQDQGNQYEVEVRVQESTQQVVFKVCMRSA